MRRERGDGGAADDAEVHLSGHVVDEIGEKNIGRHAHPDAAGAAASSCSSWCLHSRRGGTLSFVRVKNAATSSTEASGDTSMQELLLNF